MLRILYDDFYQKVKNIHDEMDLHHSYIKKKKRVCCSVCNTDKKFSMLKKIKPIESSVIL